MEIAIAARGIMSAANEIREENRENNHFISQEILEQETQALLSAIGKLRIPELSKEFISHEIMIRAEKAERDGTHLSDKLGMPSDEFCQNIQTKVDSKDIKWDKTLKTATNILLIPIYLYLFYWFGGAETIYITPLPLVVITIWTLVFDYLYGRFLNFTYFVTRKKVYRIAVGLACPVLMICGCYGLSILPINYNAWPVVLFSCSQGTFGIVSMILVFALGLIKWKFENECVKKYFPNEN